MYNVGDELTVVKIEPLDSNNIAPPLNMGDKMTVKAIVLDGKGNQHLDVGLESKVSYVRSWETKEELPDGDKIHWCHPTRFAKATAEPAAEETTKEKESDG